MVLVLGAAIWLNMKYSATDKAKYMGDTSFVSGEQDSDAVAVDAPASEDYFDKAKADRQAAYKKAEETVKEAIISAGGDTNALNAATEKAAALAKRQTDEVAVENLLTAKGFKRVLAVIGDQSVTVIVEKDSVSPSEAVVIQDVVANQCSVPVSNIKIVTVNG